VTVAAVRGLDRGEADAPRLGAPSPSNAGHRRAFSLETFGSF